MDFLGNILSGQDLVNKDYVDKAIPVVPTKLSEFTDDILAGKYLPLAGGSISGNLAVQGKITANTLSVFGQNGMTVSRLVTSVVRSTSSIEFQAYNGTLGKANSIRLSTGQLAPIGEDKELISLGNANVRWKDVYAVGGDFSGVLNVQGLVAQEAAVGGKAVLTTGNYSDYALPLSGGTVTGTIEFTASTPALKFYRDYGNVPYIHFGASPTSGYGEVGADKNGNLVFWSLVSGNSAYNAWNTVLHAKNIGDYALKKVANVTSLNTNAGEFFYSGFRPAHIPYGNYVGGITLQTFRDAENDYRTQLAFSTDAKGFVRSYTNGSWSGWKTIAFTDSNVASATKLETARKLWGNNFDGTADVAAQLTFNANDAALSAWKKDGSSTSIFLQVNPDRHLLIGQGTARENGGLYLYGNDIRMCYGNAGSSSNTSMLINSSGNVTIGASDLAGTSAKLYVDGHIKLGASGYLYKNDKTIIDFAGDAPLFGYGTAAAGLGTKVYGFDIRLYYGGTTNVGFLLNSSGNVTIGSSDTAGTSYKLRVDGTSRFTDRVSVTSLRIIPVNGSYAADFAIEGSSLTLNRELKFTNVTASDICSGIAAAFKTSLAQAENLIARNIILGASSGSASNLALSFQKYTSISNTAPNGLTTLMTLTTDGNLGIGIASPSEKLHVVGKGLFTDILTAKGGINVTASDGALNTGQSGVAGVFLRNEGGIELTHASTPYIDFHYAAGTTDFGHRLIARDSGIFAYSGNYFCPWGSESLGASSYRWKAVYAKAGNFSNDMEINGALTVGAGATFNGDVRINGNLVVTGDTASGGAGQETTLTSQLLVINQSIPTGSSVSQSALDAIGLTSDVIDNLLEGKYHHVLEVIGSNKSLYTISGYNVSGTKLIILQVGSAEADATSWYTLNQSNGGNWNIDFTEI